LHALRLLFEPLLFYFVGFLFPKDRRWVRWVVGVFVAGCVLLALHGLYQYWTKAPMPSTWVDRTETGIVTRAYSIMENPNALGPMLAMGGLLAFGLAMTSRLRVRTRVAMGLAFVVQAGGLAVTFSRGSWLGLVAGMLLMLLLAYRRYIGYFVAAGVVAWFALPRVFINRLLFAFSSTYMDISATLGRLYIWDRALNAVYDHPWFGVGLGTFGGVTASMFGYMGTYIDNFYLQVAAEGGIPLLIFFLWIVVRAAKGLVKGWRVSSDPYLRGLTAGMFGGFVAVAVASFTGHAWSALAVGAGFWFMSGLATAAALDAEGSQELPAR
jgi:O-antigen ligase